MTSREQSSLEEPINVVRPVKIKSEIPLLITLIHTIYFFARNQKSTIKLIRKKTIPHENFGFRKK
ncbi:hypothetical protein BpHYR1_023044 [Brachionus plicatilis]|uniref:Uncharacterized protein n=1 Tax=Brachionus plicatilis TaxID=10195 RepID=A0A3M7QLM4_BRAPC|nr:hypothetical protein BpHYR1_023044 [Brachionus plicatilis]